MIGEARQETQGINQGIPEGLLQISDLDLVAQGTHVLTVVHQVPHLMDDFQGLPILHSSSGHLTKGGLPQEGHQVRYDCDLQEYKMFICNTVSIIIYMKSLVWFGFYFAIYS